MITINYGPWVPDLSNNAFYIPDQDTPIDVPVADCLNICYVNGAYRSMFAPIAVSGSSTLSAQCAGIFTYTAATGLPIPMAGVVNGNPYYWQNSMWNLLFNIGFTDIQSHSYAQLGTLLCYQPVPLNVFELSTGNLFVGSSAGPISPTQISGAMFGTVLGIVGQFVMIGDLAGSPANQQIGTGNASQVTFSGTSNNVPFYPGSCYVVAGSISGFDNGNGVINGTGITGTVNYDTGLISVTFSVAPGVGVAVVAHPSQAYRSRLQWSPIGNPNAAWPTPLTNAAIAVQSGIQDLEYAYGQVMYVSGYPLYGVIFQRNAITRAQYIGGNVVFNWQTFARNQGLLAKGAAVQVSANTYFLSDAGFFSTDGANVVPIGTTEDNSAGIDQWFFSNVNKGAYSAIRAGYDASMRSVCFAIPTGSNTLPDTLLTYNIVARRWTRSAISSEMIWTDSDGSNNRLGVISQGHQYQLLTGAPSATAYLESTDLGFTDGNVRTTTAVRPNINGTSPSVVLGNRNTLNASISYSASSTPDAFGGGFAGIFGESLYTRVRVSSTNAQAINGATCDMVSGGPI